MLTIFDIRGSSTSRFCFRGFITRFRALFGKHVPSSRNGLTTWQNFMVYLYLCPHRSDRQGYKCIISSRMDTWRLVSLYLVFMTEPLINQETYISSDVLAEAESLVELKKSKFPQPQISRVKMHISSDPSNDSNLIKWQLSGPDDFGNLVSMDHIKNSSPNY